MLSVIGFFTAPFILDPLAIWQTSKARRLGHEAMAGLILGRICTVWGIGVVAGPLLMLTV